MWGNQYYNRVLLYLAYNFRSQLAFYDVTQNKLHFKDTRFLKEYQMVKDCRLKKLGHSKGVQTFFEEVLIHCSSFHPKEVVETQTSRCYTTLNSTQTEVSCSTNQLRDGKDK